MKYFRILLILLLSLSIAKSDENYEAIIEPIKQRKSSLDINPYSRLNRKSSDLLKSGFYKSIALGAGYYHYGEVDMRGKFVMRMDMAALNIALNLGYAKGGGKIDFYADANVAMGAYTGSVLDTSNETKNGKRLVAFDLNSFYNITLKGGYDLLTQSGFDSALYLQSGVGYYFNRNDFSAIERLQGYLYIPAQVEGEVILSQNWALNLMGGYNFFIFGHHHSKSTKSQFSKDLRVIQREGAGASAYIGATYRTASGNINAFGLKYEFWSVGGSPSSELMTDYSGDTTKPIRLYEPDNVSHILALQYAWRF